MDAALGPRFVRNIEAHKFPPEVSSSLAFLSAKIPLGVRSGWQVTPRIRCGAKARNRSRVPTTNKTSGSHPKYTIAIGHPTGLMDRCSCAR